MDTNILMPEQPNFHPLNSAEEKLKEQQVFWRTTMTRKTQTKDQT